MSTPSLDDLRPRLTGWQWSVRFASVVLVVLLLGWSWRSSGMTGVGQLWENRSRAVDYIFGARVDESTEQMRREEVLRNLRTEFQAEARRKIVAEYELRGEEPPGIMVLMREAQTRAQVELDSIDPGRLRAMVDERLEAEGYGFRRGGYFPPETDPKRVFGNPDRLADLHWSVRWIVELADRLGESSGRAARWVFVGISGNGYTGKLFETIAIAIWGTVLAVLLAVPASILGASRSLEILSPGRSFTRQGGRFSTKFLVRRSFDVSRGFNEIVLAMILVAVLGLGPLPGVIALMIHTYGILGKVFAEAIETIDTRQVEGVLSTGATGSQVVCLSVIPQVMPYVVSQSLLRFESNVRGATILGVVGAGGIGQLLMDKFNAYAYQEVATMMLIIIVVVTLIDFLCGRIMRRVV